MGLEAIPIILCDVPFFEALVLYLINTIASFNITYLLLPRRRRLAQAPTLKERPMVLLLTLPI